MCAGSKAAEFSASSRSPLNVLQELGPKSKVGVEYETACRAPLSNQDGKHNMTSTVDAEADCQHENIPPLCLRVCGQKAAPRASDKK